MSTKHWLRVLIGAFAALLIGLIAACGSGSSNNPSTSVAHTQQQIHHVFIITLENESAQTTFGTTTGYPVVASAGAPFLASLPLSSGAPAAAQFPAGVGAAFVPGYYGTGHVSLDNYVAMLSGQAPTVDTDDDCMDNGNVFANLTQTGTADNEQVVGTGCVYPASVKALPDELGAAGFTWKGYEGDMGNDPVRESATCGHPAIGAVDNTQSGEPAAAAAASSNPTTAGSAAATNGDYYATRHDPFMYFHSIIDNTTLCNQNVVNLDSHLQQDLQQVSTTANFNFITPSLCDDGHDASCNGGARAGGLAGADAFLQKWIPIIVNSPAFKQDGLLIINFDEGGVPTSSLNVTATPPTYAAVYPGVACCNEQPGPNLLAFPFTSTIEQLPASALGIPSSVLPASTLVSIQLTRTSVGGDQTGAVLISPFIKQGTLTSTNYNHYSMLKSIEDIFGVHELGYSGQTGLQGFGNDIFTNL